MTQPGAHSLPTKILHGAQPMTVTYPLAFIGFVARPRKGAPGNVFYQSHEVVGLTTPGVVSAFWVWVQVRRGETSWPALFTWFSPTRLRALAGLALLRQCMGQRVIKRIFGRRTS